jgi:hypothetical protein
LDKCVNIALKKKGADMNHHQKVPYLPLTVTPCARTPHTVGRAQGGRALEQLLLLLHVFAANEFCFTSGAVKKKEKNT